MIESINHFLFGHLLEVRIFPDNMGVWGKPFGEPRITYDCRSCHYHEEVKVPYTTTGRSETECWGVPVSDIRGELKNLMEYRQEYNWFSLVYKLKPRGEIIYFGDNYK